MLHFRLNNSPLQLDHARGATLGQEQLRPLRDCLERTPPPDDFGLVVILNYDGILSATASYCKATGLWLLRCGQLAAGAPVPPGTDPWQPKRFDVYPLVARLTEEVAEGLTEVFAGRGLPLLEALEWRDTEDAVDRAQLHGPLDPPARRTLDFLLDAGAATATELHERHPGEAIGVTAFNKRLAELHQLRLVRRRNQCRHWTYMPVAREVLYG